MSWNRRNTLQLLASLAAGPLLWLEASGQAAAMRRRVIPGREESLPVVGVGTWQTFDVGREDALRAPLRSVLSRLAEAGGSVVDSSPMYGRAEQVVGELAAELDLRERLFFATKVWTSGREAGLAQMQSSLALFGRGSIDLMQVHNLVDWRTQLASMRDWREQGRLRYLGLTHYVSSAYDELERVLRRERLDFVQFNYSIAAREAERRLLPFCADQGIAVLINRPYQGGGLFSRVRGRALPAWAAEVEAGSWGQLFLKYILGHPAVTCVIPGTDRETHLLDNVQAGFGALPDGPQRRRMSEWFDNLE